MTLAVSSAAQNAPAPQPSPGPFTEKTASSLLMEFSQGLTTHIENRFVTLFDFAQMKSGAVFRQQIRLLFTQTDYIRVHMNLVETTPQGEKGTMVLDAEMEAQPLTSEPPWRRNERLTLVVARSGGTWKIVDLQPRSFFSVP